VKRVEDGLLPLFVETEGPQPFEDGVQIEDGQKLGGIAARLKPHTHGLARGAGCAPQARVS
jgi:hypothetical protein